MRAISVPLISYINIADALSTGVLVGVVLKCQIKQKQKFLF